MQADEARLKGLTHAVSSCGEVISGASLAPADPADAEGRIPAEAALTPPSFWLMLLPGREEGDAFNARGAGADATSLDMAGERAKQYGVQ